jgi:glycosyltransferase involved in cell wall biosynthesis
MRIGVDATCWANPRGYGRFTREIVAVMAALAPADEFVCVVDRRAADCFDLRAPNVTTAVVKQDESPTAAASAGRNRSPIDMLRLTKAVAGLGCDAFFSPTVYSYFPLPPRLRAVVTVHDAIADRFPELTLPNWRARLFWRSKVTLALWQARIVLTVSDYAARDIVRVLGVRPSRIRVALEAPAPAYRPGAAPDAVAAAMSACGVPAGLGAFVYVGGFNPHKNIDVLIKAHAAMARTLGPSAPHLLLVGPGAEDNFHGDHRRLERIIEAEGTTALVHWPGFLPDETLRLVHSGSLALVLPSICEGFGLPAVEAAACGTPVIATTESPLPELLAGGGLFVVPGQLSPLIDALHTMATDRDARARMAAGAARAASGLTWERGAQAALNALHELR